MVAVDPLASIGIYPVNVTIGGREYEVEGHPAADWLVLLLSGEYFRVLPGWLAEEDQKTALLYDIESGAVSTAELDEVTLDILGIAAGRPWWWPMQLVMMASSSNDTWGTFHGKMLRSGVDEQTMPFGAWLDLLYSIMTDGLQQESKQQFLNATEIPDASLNIPLDEEEEAKAFFALGDI